MVEHSFFSTSECRCRSRILAVLFFFLLGHVLGVWFSCSAGSMLDPAMRTLVSSRVSIMGLLASVLMPFLFSAFAVYLDRPILLIPIAFWKAFLFSYTGYSLYTAWGSAGWLICTLVMFGSICSAPLLWWYWYRSLCRSRFEMPVFSLALAALVIICIIHYGVVSPFLSDILTF